MLTSLRKSSSVSSFCMYSLLQVYGIVHRVSFIFHLNVYLVSVYALLCWLRERGIGLVCTRRFSFHEFYNFLLFKFLILIFFGRLFFYPRQLPTPTPTTHTHNPRPLPTTHDPRHLATLGLTDLSRLFTLPCDNQSGLSTSNWSVQSIGCVSYEVLDISISGKLKTVKGKCSLIF